MEVMEQTKCGRTVYFNEAVNAEFFFSSKFLTGCSILNEKRSIYKVQMVRESKSVPNPVFITKESAININLIES